jgi:hypothetical protein
MKFSKPWAIIFLMGLFIHAMAAPPTPLQASSSGNTSMTPQERPAGRPGLPSVSQESESIDSFNVHPANRWSEGTSGTFDETLENGEFSIEGFDNSSSSNLRYRDAETTAGDIETRWRLNYTEQGTTGTGSDFEVPLIGLNVTTDEGSGNSSLNAYPWNSTHYILRPTFTTDDGDNWRSWNIESDYQDFFALDGSDGPDGEDFIEGDEEQGYSGMGAESVTGGIYTATCGAGAFERLESADLGGFSLDPAKYSYYEVKIRSSDATLTAQPYFGAPGTQISTAQTLGTTGWTTLQWDLSTDSNWNSSKTWYRWGFQFDETDDTLEGNEVVWIDYIRLFADNDSSDLTFFEYETYYRATMKYNLLTSELNWKVESDAGSKLTSTVQGSFAIEDYFDPDELIRDISLGTVGDIDYLFGLRSAGANATCWWDFYMVGFLQGRFPRIFVDLPR